MSLVLLAAMPKKLLSSVCMFGEAISFDDKRHGHGSVMISYCCSLTHFPFTGVVCLLVPGDTFCDTLLFS